MTYLRWSAPGLPGMLLVLASTGALRGLLDTRTPLVVAARGAVVNAVLNIVLVYGVGMGIAGSGLGTALTQLGHGRRAVRRGRPRRPRLGGAPPSGRRRDLDQRARRRAPVRPHPVAAARHPADRVWWPPVGAVELAGHQIVNAVWGLPRSRSTPSPSPPRP